MDILTFYIYGVVAEFILYCVSHLMNDMLIKLIMPFIVRINFKESENKSLDVVHALKLSTMSWIAVVFRITFMVVAVIYSIHDRCVHRGGE